MVQQGLDLLQQQDADAQADHMALRALLAERAAEPWASGDEVCSRLAARRAAHEE